MENGELIKKVTELTDRITLSQKQNIENIEKLKKNLLNRYNDVKIRADFINDLKKKEIIRYSDEIYGEYDIVYNNDSSEKQNPIFSIVSDGCDKCKINIKIEKTRITVRFSYHSINEHAHPLAIGPFMIKTVQFDINKDSINEISSHPDLHGEYDGNDGIKWSYYDYNKYYDIIFTMKALMLINDSFDKLLESYDNKIIEYLEKCNLIMQGDKI